MLCFFRWTVQNLSKIIIRCAVVAHTTNIDGKHKIDSRGGPLIVFKTVHVVITVLLLHSSENEQRIEDLAMYILMMNKSFDN